MDVILDNDSSYAICRLGSMVAMFRYSSVATYSVSLPHWKVEFSNSIGGKFLKKEIEDVGPFMHNVALLIACSFLAILLYLPKDLINVWY